MIRRNAVRGRDRRQVTEAQPGRAGDVIATAGVISGNVANYSTTGPVLVTGLIPQWLIEASPPRTIVAVTQIDTTHFRITFDGTSAAVFNITITSNDPSIRTRFGGYLAAGLGI